MEKILVGIVEDDTVWISVMKRLLQQTDDIIVSASATNRTSANQMMKENPNIQVVLMDLNLTENQFDGIQVANEIHQGFGCKVIMLTSYTDRHLILDSYSAGAVNFVSKENYNHIPHAIREACRNPFGMGVLLTDYRKAKGELRLSSLTPSERQILDLASQGHSRSKMTSMLYKSENTMKSQISSILKKLRCSSLSEAAQSIFVNKG